jgi:hypothetical protein
MASISGFHPGDTSSSLVFRSCGSVVQLVERLSYTEYVASSSLAGITKWECRLTDSGIGLLNRSV